MSLSSNGAQHNNRATTRDNEGLFTCEPPRHPSLDRGQTTQAPKSLNPEKVRRFLEEAKDLALTFTRETGLAPASSPVEKSKAEIPDDALQQFDNWYRLPESQSRLGDFMASLASKIERFDMRGHPGHDARHILIQDPLAGLKLVEGIATGEPITGARRLFLISSMLHDFGRLLDPALGRADKELESAVAREHSTMSFAETQRLLQHSSLSTMPVELKNHIAFATLAHTQGDYPKHPLTQYTTWSDRAQIYGHEGLLRMLACDVALKGLALFPSDPATVNSDRSYGGDDKNMLGHMCYFLRHGMEFPSRAPLAAVTGRIVYELVKRTPYEQQVFPENATDARAAEYKTCTSELPPEVQAKINALGEQYPLSRLADLACAVTSAPGATPIREVNASPPNQGLTGEELLRQKVAEVPAHMRGNLRDALLYALATRPTTEQETGLDRFLGDPDTLVRGTAKIIAQAMNRYANT